jgi:Flp pilus assembly protein TadG
MRVRIRLPKVRLHLRNEQGATAVMVAIMLVVFFGITTLAVDGGRLYAERRREVRAADSAALAAALSFAMNQAQCGTFEAPAQAQADNIARRNVLTPNQAVRVAWTTDCAAGTVTVRYRSRVDQLFAPVLGFPSNRQISAQATAHWGIAGAAHPIPIMLRQSWIDDCTLQPGGGFQPPGTFCTGIWLDNNPNALGDAQWAFLNLNPYPGAQGGWNVPPTYNCPNSGAAIDPTARGFWILYGAPWELPVNYPSPTYVCGSSGHASSNYAQLASVVGQIRQFPINCPYPDEAPACNNLPGVHGQLDNNGNLCPPPCSQPDKYDIVSFSPLRLEQVLHGNDPGALGSPGLTGQCNPTGTFSFDSSSPGVSDTKALSSITGTGCPAGIQPDNVTPYGTPADPYAPYVYDDTTNTAYTPCNVGSSCPPTYDYTYDPTTKTITWQAANLPVTGVRMRFNWSTNGVQGACGTTADHNPDPNAICLVLSWQGPQPGGGDPGTPGYDFGLRGVSLCAHNEDFSNPVLTNC